MMGVGDIDSKIMYDLMMAFSSYTELKRKIILCLAHIYPQAISGTQLAQLIGYSGKARTLYRGILNRLQEDAVILIDKLTPKLYSIRINHDHHLMKFLIDLTTQHGTPFKKKYLEILQKGLENE